MTPKNTKLVVQGYAISFIKDTEYISLTDIAKRFGDLGLIDNWLRNKNAVEFLGVWERSNNSEFNSVEFDGIMNEAGLNRASTNTPLRFSSKTRKTKSSTEISISTGVATSNFASDSRNTSKRR